MTSPAAHSTSHVGLPPDFLTVGEAAAVLRIGRTVAYELARKAIATGGASGLPTVVIGRQFRVPRVQLEELLGGPITWPIPTAPRSSSPTAEPPRPTARHRTPNAVGDPQLFSA